LTNDCRRHQCFVGGNENLAVAASGGLVEFASRNRAYLTSITQAEILARIELLPKGKRKRRAAIEAAP